MNVENNIKFFPRIDRPSHVMSIRHILFFAFLSIVLAACGDGSVQRKQVINDVENKIDDDVYILAHFKPLVDRRAAVCVWIDRDFARVGLKANDAYQTERLADRLQELEFITYRKETLKGENSRFEMGLVINDADHVVSYAYNRGRNVNNLGCERKASQNISIFLGELDDIEVTGIEKISDTLNTASFKVSVKTNEISPTLFPDFEFIEGTFEYQLWDDGWREKKFSVENPFKYTYGEMGVTFTSDSLKGLAVRKLTLMQSLGKYFDGYEKLIKNILNDDEATPWNLSLAAQSYCDNNEFNDAYRVYEKQILKNLEGEELASWNERFIKFKSKCEESNEPEITNQTSSLKSQTDSQTLQQKSSVDIDIPDANENHEVIVKAAENSAPGIFSQFFSWLKSFFSIGQKTENTESLVVDGEIGEESLFLELEEQPQQINQPVVSCGVTSPDDEIKQLAIKIQEASEKSEILSNEVISETMFPDLLVDISQLLLRNGLQVKSIKPTEGASKKSSSEKIVHLSFEGDLNQIWSLLNDLGTNNRLLSIESSTIKRLDKSKVQQEMVLRIPLRTANNDPYNLTTGTKQVCLDQNRRKWAAYKTRVLNLQKFHTVKNSLPALSEQLENIFREDNKCLALSSMNLKFEPSLEIKLDAQISTSNDRNAFAQVLNKFSYSGYSAGEVDFKSSQVEAGSVQYQQFSGVIPFVKGEQASQLSSFTCESANANPISQESNATEENISAQSDILRQTSISERTPLTEEEFVEQQNDVETQKNELVKNVQQELKRLGLYYSSIDGIAGGGTAKGIREYERQIGLPITGVATNGLYTRLSSTSPNMVSPLSTKEHAYAETEEKHQGTIIGNAAKKSFRWLGDKLKGNKK